MRSYFIESLCFRFRQAAALKETWKAQRERLALGAGMTEEGGTAAGEDSSLVDQSAAANGSGNESDVSGKDDDFSNAAGADSTVDESDGKGVAASDDAPHVRLIFTNIHNESYR